MARVGAAGAAATGGAARLTCRLHPEIPLILHNAAPYPSRDFLCDLCFKIGEGPTYHCKVCKYDLHPKCCTLQPQLRSCAHPHLLTLHGPVGSVSPKKSCDACRTPLEDSEWHYRCEQCDFDVHAFCAKLRDKILTGFHTLPLKLLQKSPYPPRQLRCCLCEERMPTNAWVYHCPSCRFDLHPACALFPRDPLCSAVHPHRLSSWHYDTFHGKSYVCAACFEFGGKIGFRCDECDFDIHPNCLQSFVSPSSGDTFESLHDKAREFKVTAYGVHIRRKADSEPVDVIS